MSEIQREKQKSFRDATAKSGPVAVVTEQDRKRLRPEYNAPSIQKKDYIEYDFSTMKDSRGGFLDETDKNGLKGPEEEPQSLQEWKEKQKQELLVKDLAPPLDLENAPRCVECESLDLDANLHTNFGVLVCRRCMKEKPEKYALLTKTECREDYLLTEPELKDTGLLRRIEKPNPHGFSRMQLFLRLQVEEFAWKKWGSAEGLDAEWERREGARLDRREKRYQAKMKEMRKKTRAEESHSFHKREGPAKKSYNLTIERFLLELWLLVLWRFLYKQRLGMRQRDCWNAVSGVGTCGGPVYHSKV
ncbi:hypothetical protein JCM33374_g6526 [Metschnikowia sp. JCM 33374]|nr:hypothetical protein JCM33374_g6526 [Metschnikowia sp. JCM 33374]